MTDIPMKDYVDRVLCEQRKYMDERFRAIEKSTGEAKEDMSVRLESMNEFRRQLKEQEATFITRPEHDKIVQDIRELRESRAELQGKASMGAVYIAYIFGAINLIIGIILVIERLARI